MRPLVRCRHREDASSSLSLSGLGLSDAESLSTLNASRPRDHCTILQSRCSLNPFETPNPSPSSSSLLLSSLELSDTQFHEPWIRDLLGTASHFCEAVVLKFLTPNPTHQTGSTFQLHPRSRLTTAALRGLDSKLPHRPGGNSGANGWFL